MKKSLFKKLISLAASCVMALSILPTAASAARIPQQYRIAASQPAHAYVWLNSPRAYEDDTVNVRVTTDDGYRVEYLNIYWYEDDGFSQHTYLYEDDAIVQTSDNDMTWEFTMPSSNVTISAYVVKDWRASSIEVRFVDDNYNMHGELYSTRYRPRYGEEIIISAVPDEGYTVDYLKVNNETLTPIQENYGGREEFRYVVNDRRISVRANFVRANRSLHSIKLNAMTGGTASLNLTSARAGETIRLTVSPNSGMAVDTVKNGSTVLTGKNNVYTFTMPASNVNLSVTFKSDKTNSGTSNPSTPSNPSSPSAPSWFSVGGRWKLKQSNGSYVTGWYPMNGQWYYMDAAGDMLTGWQLIGNKWYYLKPYGAMKTGWLKLGNTWYYLKDNGAMATGWCWVGNRCYYFYPSGKMAANTTINGHRLNASGAWVR